jgi:hypothetical protein
MPVTLRPMNTERVRFAPWLLLFKRRAGISHELKMQETEMYHVKVTAPATTPPCDRLLQFLIAGLALGILKSNPPAAQAGVLRRKHWK